MQRVRYVLFILILLGGSSLTGAQVPYEFGFELNKTYIWDSKVVLESNNTSQRDRTSYEYSGSIVIHSMEVENISPGIYRYNIAGNYTLEFRSGNLEEFQSNFNLDRDETSEVRNYYSLYPHFSPINDEYLSSLNDTTYEDPWRYREFRISMGSNTYEIQENEVSGNEYINRTYVYSLNTGVLLKYHYVRLDDQYGTQEHIESITIFRGLETLYIPPYSYYAMATLSILALLIIATIIYFVRKRKRMDI